MELTVVGSGTAAPEPERVCSAFFITAGGTRVLVDCGPGAVHHLARFTLPWQRLDHLVISHFHNDHIGDLPMLMFALKWGLEQRRTAPLSVWAPPGIQGLLAGMAGIFGDHVTDPGFPLHVHEIAPGHDGPLGRGLSLAATATPHTDHSLALRFQARRAGTIGYTGDTGPSHDVALFLAGVDLLIAECSFPDDLAMDSHLTPSSLAGMAHTARPGRLMVSHVYPQLDRHDVAALIAAAGWDGPVVRAKDGMALRVPFTEGP